MNAPLIASKRGQAITDPVTDNPTLEDVNKLKTMPNIYLKRGGNDYGNI